MRRPPAVVRGLVPHRLALGAVVATVTLSAALLAALTSFAATVGGRAVRDSLAAGGTAGVSVTASVTSAADALRAMPAVGTALRRALPGASVTASLVSDDLNVPAAGRHAQTHLVSLPGLSGHATLAAGRWPAGSRAAGGAVPAAATTTLAARLHLSPGTVLNVSSATSGSRLRVRITGTFRAVRPSAPFWRAVSVTGGPQTVGGFTVLPALVTTQQALTRSDAGVTSAAWSAAPDIQRLGPGNLLRVSGALRRAGGVIAGVRGLAGTTASTGLAGRLAALARAMVIEQSQLTIGLLILLVMTGAAVGLVTSLLSSQRGGEAALLRARGASGRQLAVVGLGEAVLLVTPAITVGPLLGGLLPPAARWGEPAAGLRVPVAFPALSWLLSAAVAAACGLIIGQTWLLGAQSPVSARVRRGRQQVLAVTARSGADLALLALAVLAGWQLTRYRTPVSAGLNGAIGVDPVLVSAPLLALAAGAMLTLRLLPLAARLGDWAAVRVRGLASAVAAWQVSRRPLRHAGPVLLAVFAVAATVLATGQWASWHRSAADRASFATGSGLRVTLSPSASLPAGRVDALAGASGVTGATPALRTAIGLPNGGTATLLALDARRAIPVAMVRPGLMGGSPARVLASLAPRQPPPGAPVPGRPARLLISARLRAAGLGQPVLQVSLTDAFGIAYQVQAGTLPPDGRVHTLTVPFSPRGQAAYPLRLTGIGLDYLMPRQRAPRAVLTVLRTGAAGALRPARQFITAGAAGPGGRISQQPGGVTATARGTGLAASFLPGAGEGPVEGTCGPANEPARFRRPCGPHSRLPVTLTLTAAAPPGPVPAAVTRTFTAATGLRRGMVFAATVAGATVDLRAVSVIAGIPTTGGPSGAVLADQSAIQRALAGAGALPSPVTEWWLRTTGTVALPALPAGSQVYSRARLVSSLLAEPLAAAPQVAMLAVAGAAVLLALAGFGVAAATARERARDFALLVAIGTTRRQLTRLACLEQAALSVPAAGVGLLLGTLVARLVVPAVTVTATGARPQPPAVTVVPLLIPAAVAIVIAGMPVLIAAAGTRWPPVVRHTRVEAQP
jgi:FtsX-like permease family